MAAEIDFYRILEVLYRHRVDFIVVGGVAAILEGAPVSTFDLDIVHRPSEENLSRLLAALNEINAIYKDPAGRTISPDLERLRTFKLHLLSTDLGPLDILSRIGDGMTWEDLKNRSRQHDLEEFEVRAIDLDTLIETKAHANRPKDQIALIYLREILAQRKS